MGPLPTREAMRLLHDGALAFAGMERNGVLVDRGLLEQNLAAVQARAAALTEELHADPLWGEWCKRHPSPNANSPQQVADMVYGHLGRPVVERTEKGQPSTSEKALLATGEPFFAKYVERKKLEKTSGTFLKGIRDHLCPDGRLRPSYLLHSATSYRSSSRDPNAQNFPKRNPAAAALVRPCFVAPRGKRLVEIDYAGIEVRVSACYNRDPALINYIEDPSTDMHRDTAMELFFLSKEQVDKRTTRDWAKNRFVFPQFYGSVYFQCAPHLWEAVTDRDKGEYRHRLPDGVPIYEHLRSRGIKELGACDPSQPPREGTFERHVKHVEDGFWKRRFRVYSQWKRSFYDEYVRNGFFRSLTGFVYEWGGGDDDGEGRGGRLPKRNDVLNYAIQGSAFHCMLWSIIRITKWLRAEGMRSKVVGQIHDSVLIEADERELQKILTRLDALMTVELREHWPWIVVPMAVEFEVSEVGGNWHEQKQWVCGGKGWGPK
jgi:DNA polymerase I-like protein with 3'-5' exonuclease and polymerase domains